MLKSATDELNSLANNEIAAHSQKFFKTGKGEYGEGDLFIGIRVPNIRKIAKKYTVMSLPDTKRLIHSKIHEERLLGLIILTNKFTQAEKSKDETTQTQIYKMYCAHFNYINNWDLVDVSCPKIIGKYLLNKDRAILLKWAKSDHLWTRRIAVVTNWWFIRSGDLASVFPVAKILLHDSHDLIHKAVGWMLREAAKKDSVAVEEFLSKFYIGMPRTMLRYAIENFPQNKRLFYMKKS